MAVNFPPNPSIGDTVTDPATGTVWTWDGYKWTFTPGSGGGGGTVDPADLISAEAGNYIELGNDGLLYAPTPGPIVGVTDGSNAAPGMVGEYISSVTNAGAVALTSISAPNTQGSCFNITTITLTPGDWDVGGFVMINGAGGGGSSFTYVSGGIWTVPTQLPTQGNATDGIRTNLVIPSTNVNISAPFAIPVATFRMNVTVPTIMYLNAQATFTGTATAQGRIWARRAR